ncbi:hypothetical protein HHK36_028296 [Tetracentron sinense]|uniref:Uncharacterized protein n=1 Tax=Tetracentron sinense TaxID=13715 RepID=A0A835D1Y7_TETSI|nr:hypothetical protein HHK36_028296 [Tetracentron sinense]
MLGLSSLQKITAAMRMLAYRVTADYVDEYVRIGSHNDINVLERSSVFTDLADGCAAAVNYTVNGNDYAMGYYLANGIYLQWSTFVKTISSPQGNKQKYFAAAQESARKDVERAFGVLQTRFAIVHGPTQDFNYDAIDDSPHAPVLHERTTELMEFIRDIRRIRDMGTHSQLQADLVEQLW